MKEDIKDEVKFLVALFDDVFFSLGQDSLLNNNYFQIGELSTFHCICIESVPNSEKINLNFDIATYGVTFYIDQTSEIPEWSYKLIKSNTELFKAEIKNIFSSFIQIEYKGTKTTLKLLDNLNNEIRKYTFIKGLGINWFTKPYYRHYKPYFEKA